MLKRRVIPLMVDQKSIIYMSQFGFPVKTIQRKWSFGPDFEAGKTSLEGQGFDWSTFGAALISLVWPSGINLRGRIKIQNVQECRRKAKHSNPNRSCFTLSVQTTDVSFSGRKITKIPALLRYHLALNALPRMILTGVNLISMFTQEFA